MALHFRTPLALSLGAMTAAFALISCGGGASKPEAKAPEVSSEDNRFPEDDTTPLEPATAPYPVLAKARIKDPARLVEKASGAASVPLDLGGGFLLDSPEAKELLSALDIHGSIEAVVALHPVITRPPLEVHSVAAHGVRPVLQLLDQRGIEAMEGPGGAYFFTFESQPCAVGRARGPAKARVVCSEGEEALRELLPYALRGLPEEALSDADAYAELFIEPVHAAYGKQLRAMKTLAAVFARQLHIDHPKFDDALTDAFIGLSEELALVTADAKSVSAELRLKDDNFRLDMKAEFKGHSSFIAETLREAPRGPAPAFFGKLPATASAAGYTHPVGKGRMVEIASILSALVGGYAEHEGISQKTVGHLESLTRGVLTFGRDQVSASGPLVSRVDGDSATLGPAWQLLGFEGDRKELLSLLDDVAHITADKKLLAFLPDSRTKPYFRRKNAKVKGAPQAVVYEWSLGDVASDALDESELSGDEALTARALSLTRGQLAVFEFDGAVWLSWGSTPEVHAEAVQALTSKSAERLSAVNGVAELRERPGIGAGYLKLEGILGSFSALIPDKVARSWDRTLRATPSGGQVPLVYFVDVRKEGDSTIVVAEEDIPGALVADVIALAVMIGAEFK